MALIQKAFSDIITFSRSSNATRVGPTGLVEYAPHNLLQRSQEFDNAYWTKSNVTITANAASAPDGTVTADLMLETTATGGHSAGIGSALSSGVYTISFYAKYYSRQWVRVDLTGVGSAICYFDIQNGALGNMASGASGTITGVGNGWYRCAVAFTGAAFPYMGLASANGTVSYTGVATEGAYFWGAQLAVGPYPLDYTPTTSAAVYGPRFDFDPVTLAARGLLVEEQRTNIATYSEDLSNAAWSKVNATIAANSLTSPDGQTTADKIVENTNTGQHEAYQVLSFSSGPAYTLSFYAKPAGRNYVFLIHNGTGAYTTSYWNISDGTVVSSGSGITNAIQSVGNGWYRITSTFTSAMTSAAFEIGCSDTGARTSYTGDGTSGIYLWGAQLEAGSFATSYLPTLASTVTRSADVASVNTLSPWFNASTGTLYSEVEKLSSGVDLVRGAMLHDGSVLNRINSGAATSTGEGGVVVTGNVNQVAIGGSISTVGPHKLAFAYAANDFALSANGGAVSTDTSGTIPTVTTLGIGSLTSSYVGNGYVRRIAYYPRRLTNAELQALSA